MTMLLTTDRSFPSTPGMNLARGVAGFGLRLLGFGIALGCAAVIGCAPMSTYPSVEVESVTRPGWEPIPTIMALAVRSADQEYGTVDPLIFNLPKGTPAYVYRTVLNKLEEGTPQMMVDQPAYHVVEVRVRTTDAEADVIVPRGDGLEEMVTFYYKRPVAKPWEGYALNDMRPWRIPVKTPTPTYIPDGEPLPVFESQPDSEIVNVPEEPRWPEVR